MVASSHPPLHQPPPEVIRIDKNADQVRCDGGIGAMGHPTVWYNVRDVRSVRCLYCDRLFIKDYGQS